MIPDLWKARPGINLIEAVVAAGVAAIVLLALGGFIASTFKVTNSERDRTFAMQKAIQMMEELAAYKATSAADAIDQFADGFQFPLTIAKDAPAHAALSGNPVAFGKSKFVRAIEVVPVPGDPFARRVTVKVYYASKSGAAAPADTGKALAVVTNVLRSTAANTGPRQVIDVYVLSIENLPHVYREDDDEFYFPSARDARLLFESAVTKFESLNSGIDLQLHYISRLSEGRDALYRPYINKGKPLDGGGRDPLNRLYYYPGVLSGGASDTYFDPDGINGRVAVGDSAGVGVNSGNYAIADQFNHAVRYPAEFTFASSPQARHGAPKLPLGKDGNPLTELSLRQFVEELTAGSVDKYRNAVVVNLHGELFPVVPARNYSDAARDPGEAVAEKRKRRVVTHPYKLVTPIATEPVRLLLHPYLEGGKRTPTASAANDRFVVADWPWADYSRDARIIIKGIKNYLDVLPSDTDTPGSVDRYDIKVEVVQRERQNNGNANTRYVRVVEWPEASGGLAGGEYESGRKAHSGPHVTLHDSTFHHSPASGHGSDPNFADLTGDGTADDFVIDVTDLDYDARWTDDGGVKYGLKENSGDADPDYLPHRLQYFPDPFLPFLDVANSEKYPRNTARVIVEFRLKTTGAYDATKMKFEVETQLKKAGGWPTSPADPAVTRTWFYTDGITSEWDATRRLYWDAAGDRPAIPWTEQLQLLGDPRHNPYLDVRKKELFNPYFSDFRAGQKLYAKDDLTNNTGDAAKCLDAINPFCVGADRPTSVGTAFNIAYPNSADDWHETKVDLPAYLRMWRHAIMRNSLIFVNQGGEPLRFIGLGGEFELNGDVNAINDLDTSRKPYNGDASADADDNARELTANNTPWLERQGGDNWYAKPWLGELYPTDRASEWTASGNLNSGSGIWRVDLSDISAYAYATDREQNRDKKRIHDGVGLATLLNAEDNAGSGPIELDEGGSKATLTATGKAAASALRQVLSASLKSRVGYKLNGADGADTPSSWSRAPYTAASDRLLMDWLDEGESPPGYYTQDQGSGYYAVNPILLLSSATAASSRKGVVLPVTFRPESVDDLPKIFEAGLSSMVQAFFDGTKAALSANHVRPASRIKITQPKHGAMVVASQPIEFYAKWSKVDGTEYSPFYTFSVAGAPAMVHYIKYREKPSGTWKALDGSAATPGVPDAAVLEIASATYPAPITYAWNTAALSAGEYELRVEGYRRIGGVLQGAHHTYHQIDVVVE